jgi:hypothetical protein
MRPNRYRITLGRVNLLICDGLAAGMFAASFRAAARLHALIGSRWDSKPPTPMAWFPTRSLFAAIGIRARAAFF